MTASTTSIDTPRQPAPLPALPRIAPDHAALSRLLGRGRAAGLPALGAGAALTVWPQGADTQATDWSGALRLDGGFGTLLLAQAARVLHALTGIDLDGVDGPQDERWSWLEAAVLGRLAGTPLAGTRRLTPAAAGAAAEPHVILPLTLHSGGHCIATAAGADAAGWLALLRGDGWRALAAPASALDQLAPCWPLPLARHQLTPAQLRACRPGDVIVPTTAAFDCGGDGVLTLGPLRLRVRYAAPCTLTILALEPIMSAQTDLPDTPPADAADPLDQLPLTIAFELGSLRLTLAQLRQLDGGSVLELADASTAAVRIVCAGRRIGSGEAVDVGGRLGIRITDWDAA